MFLSHASTSLKQSLPETLRAGERILVRLEQPLWGALYRIGIGYVMLPIFKWLSWSDETDWQVILLFIGMLFAMRLIPAIIRMSVPFSREVTEAWLEKRQLAKDFDSYQWQKLFWLGAGMIGYITTSGVWSNILAILAGFSLLTGGIGLFLWRSTAHS